MEEENNKEKPVKKLGNLTLDIVKLIDSQPKLKGNNQPKEFAESMKMNDAAMQHHSVNDRGLNGRLKIRTAKSIDLNFLKLTINQIKLLSTDDLLKLLSGEGHKGAIQASTIQLISNEILSRQIITSSKPHWTTYAVLLLTFIAAVTGVVSILK